MGERQDPQEEVTVNFLCSDARAVVFSAWFRSDCACPTHMSKLRNMFNRNLSQKRGKEMSSRRDAF